VLLQKVLSSEEIVASFRLNPSLYNKLNFIVRIFLNKIFWEQNNEKLSSQFLLSILAG